MQEAPPPPKEGECVSEREKEKETDAVVYRQTPHCYKEIFIGRHLHK